MTETNNPEGKPTDPGPTKKEMIAWREMADADSLETAVYDYLEITCGNTHWPLVAEDGINLAKPMLHEDQPLMGIIELIINSVAAQAQHGAISAMAAAIGTNPNVVQGALEDWQEPSGNGPEPAIGFRGLESLIKEIESHAAAGEPIG